MIADELILDLTDQEYRLHVIECLQEFHDEPTQAIPLRKYLLRPLENWIDSEYQRFGGHHSGTKAGASLFEITEDIVYDLENSSEIYPEVIAEFSTRWQYWIETVGSSSIRIAHQNDIASKKQAAKGGRKPKRRVWAERAAESVTCWEDLPESGTPFEFEDLMVNVYRDGNKLCAADMYNSDAEPKTLARSTFEKRYLKK